MKVAIYSRVIDEDQYNKVQQLLDELDKENITPVIYQPFYEMIQSSVRFSERTTVFSDSNDLTES
ncbi:MAG TPA: NAD(+) kinase, partial [Niastella sp.]